MKCAILASMALAVYVAGSSAVTLAAATGDGGGMSTGGGELILDNDNPWWLENTSQVSYCINVDADHFHLSRERIGAVVQQALAYWKTEFGNARYPTNTAGTAQGTAKIATQEFYEVACSNDTDMIFQFGVLGDGQRARLGDPRNFIAAAIRESYDKTQLRGRGFVYVAPDSGPDQPLSSTLVANPWAVANGELLYRVVLHELGHVFGLEHNGGRGSLMGAGFPENVVSKVGAEMAQRHPEFPSFFRYSGVLGNGAMFCGGLTPAVKKFWGLPDDAISIYTAVHDHQIDVAYATTAHPGKCIVDELADRKPVGTILISDHCRTSTGGNHQMIFLPQEQGVFPNVFSGHYLASAGMITEKCSATYSNMAGDTVRQVNVNLRPDLSDFLISGVLDNQLLTDALGGF